MIIALTGKAGIGKTTASKELGTRVYSFAAKIKSIAKQLGWDSIKDEKGRRLLQELGTAGRHYNINIWAELTRDMLKKDYISFIKQNGFEPDFFIDDLRYDNEANVIHEIGGIVIKLEGKGKNIGKNKTHESEKGISKKLIDYSVERGTILDTQKRIEYIMQREKIERVNNRG